MRILVTGGAGFVGSHLCERLLQQEHEVICVDNFYTGRKENIASLAQNPRFELLRHDMVEPLMVEVDRIYNLACPASPVHYQKNPIKTIKANVLGSLHVLGIAKRAHARVLQASTSEVYGDPEQHPQKELYFGNVNCIGPRSCYDEGKRVAESLFMAYHHYNGVDVRIARIFNTYGPRMLADDGRVVSNFIVSALRGAPLRLCGDGSQTRSFCYVDDLVDGLMRLMESSLVGPVNLGNPAELSVEALAQTIARLTHSSSTIEYVEAAVDDPKRRQPDITLARLSLGWEPKVALTEGLARTIDYFRARL